MKGHLGIALLFVALLIVISTRLALSEPATAQTNLGEYYAANPATGSQHIAPGRLAMLTADALNIELIGQIGGQTQAVVVDGSYAYSASAAGVSGLRIIDVANPAQPTEVGFYDTPGAAFDVAKAGNLIHVADGAAGLQIIDVSNPINPIETGYYDNLEFPTDVAAAGSYSYVADLQDGLQIIDVTNPANPMGVGNYDTPGTDWGITVAGHFAYVAATDGGLLIIDVANPAAPIEAGHYRTPGDALGVAVAGNFAYVADDEKGLRIINIMDPATPTEVGFYDTPGAAENVVVAGHYAYIADRFGGLRVIDVSDPTIPTEAGYYVIAEGAYDVDVAGNLVFVASGASLLVLEFQPELPSPELNINRNVGAPGSFFTVSGSDYPPDEVATVIINSQELNSISVENNGTFSFILSTTEADEGYYSLVVGSAAISFVLDSDKTIWPQEGVGPVIDVPAGIAYTESIFLPATLR